MRIAFYAPFKPLGHAHPSGDRAIARGLYAFLTGRGHRVWPVSDLRARWIYWQPWRWPGVLRERRRALRLMQRLRPDLWLTYHTYYKAPDLLGPRACRSGVPYVVFQGIYSTKRKKRWRTWPGYLLNRRALCAAAHVFTNRREDWHNLRRIVPAGRLTHLVPGINPGDFRFDPAARNELRRQWQVGDGPVILSAAMFRPGVKADGLVWVIRACERLWRRGYPIRLVIAGDGQAGERLRSLADACLPGRVRFLGKVARGAMHRFYSAGDIFVFPGIRESLGMVYLEAQSCGLPVVAFDNGGVPEVVRDRESGILVPTFAFDAFTDAIERLVAAPDLRRQMGRRASCYVRQRHDLALNYDRLETVLQSLVQASAEAQGGRTAFRRPVNGEQKA